MNKRALACFVIVLLAAFLVCGCGTAQKKMQTEVTGIKSRVETLESRVETVESKQAEVERTTAEQAMAIDDIKSVAQPQPGTNISVKPRAGAYAGKMKDIQRALKTAGYYDGKIDGIKGKGTKKAIKDFQRANGLQIDGVVGSRTWELLSRYLSAVNEPAMSAQAGGDEGIK
ncbi:MAG: peptidoglycan-binding protein [Candidatus Omnitrophica bacterium]|nr:peptidoglycan-binding protein [Candidatus Omnitrophota bacterium]